MGQLFGRILVPHDFSQHAEKALDLAADLAAEHKGRLLVLNAIPQIVPLSSLAPNDVPVWVPTDELIGQARRDLEALVKRSIRGRVVPYECQVVVGDPSDRILRAAKGCDLVVMATAGRTGLSHLVIGSVAEKVVRHSPAPVLTVRAKLRRARMSLAPSRGRKSARARAGKPGRARR